MKPLAEIGLALIMLGGCRMAEAPAAPQAFSGPVASPGPTGIVVVATDPPGYNYVPPTSPASAPANPVASAQPTTPAPVAPAPVAPAPVAPAPVSAQPVAGRGPRSIPWIVPAAPAPTTPAAAPARLPEAVPPSAAAPNPVSRDFTASQVAAPAAAQPPKPDWSFLNKPAPEPAKPPQPVLPVAGTSPAAPNFPGPSQSAHPVLPAAPALADTMPAMVAAPVRTGTASPAPAASDIRLVNSKRISLNYKVNNVGSSGVTAVELWCTRDGRTWKKLKTSEQAHPPCIIDVEEEDLYGFTLVVRSGVGLGKPPQEGDKPQVWVEVDTTRPVVRLMGVEAGPVAQGRSLSIRWKATDKNLGQRPITLLYATEAAGPWKPIAMQLENTGYYVWHIPNEVPHHLLVRVEAADLVGNIGVAQTTNPLLDDLAQPTASILAVEGKGN